MTRKILIAAFIAAVFLTLFTISAYAAEQLTPAETADIRAAQTAVAPVPAAAVDNGIVFSPAVGADVLYDGTVGAIVPCISVQFATALDGMLEARALATMKKDNMTSIDKVGIGLGANLPKLATAAKATWVATVFNPSIGLAILTSPVEKTFSWGLYLTAIKVPLN